MGTQAEVDTVLDSVMKIYVSGDQAATLTDTAMSAIYPTWEGTKGFLRNIRKKVVNAEDGFNHKDGDEQVFKMDFVTRIVEEAFEEFGVFQDSDCKQMKLDLLKYGDSDTGL